MIGWIGMGLLILANAFFYFEKTEKYYVPIMFVSSICLVAYSMLLTDIPFIIVNLFVCLIFGGKLYKKRE